MSSQEYYHSVIHQDEFTDSVVIQPISMKPSVIPTFLYKNINDNTILSSYDHIKLTQYIEQGQNGKIVKLIDLDQNSLISSISSQANQLLQKFSANQIAFVSLVGQSLSGKSFLIDKILNLSNIQGNKFSITNRKPGIYAWSLPYIKQDLRIFIIQLANCSIQSKQFNILLPYISLLSSVIINLDSFRQKTGYQSCSKLLTQKVQVFSKRFVSQINKSQFGKILYNNIFPQRIINVKRKRQNTKGEINNNNFGESFSQQFYLPNAMNPQYRGMDQDLRVHSFLNKKCINEEYIYKVSQLFKRVHSSVLQKKQGQLVFNGSIILKYLYKLQSVFNKKKQIDLEKIYYEIVKDLYVSAYNYCVITYHQMLEQALSDQRPRSIDELLNIFENSSNDIFDKYNEFTLQQSLHKEYEYKLIQHIESKQKLIIEINKKKANLQLTKIYDKQINFNHIQNIWQQIQSINNKNTILSHAQYDVIGKKLAQYLPKLLQGNNQDQKIKKQINQLNNSIQIQSKNLYKIKQINKQKKLKNIKMNEQIFIKKTQLQSKTKQLDDKLFNIKKQIKIYSKTIDLDGGQLKQQKQKYQQFNIKNDKTILKLKQQAKQPVENHNLIVQTKKQIQNVKKKQQRLQMTLTELSKQEKATGLQQKQGNIKKSTQSNGIKQVKKSKQNKQINESKNTNKQNTK